MMQTPIRPDDGCPYGDRMCPKVDDIAQGLKETRKAIHDMHRVLYIIVGILTIQLGVTIL